MKVTLLRRLAQHKAGEHIEYSNDTAAWLIAQGYAKATARQAERTAKSDAVVADINTGASTHDGRPEQLVQADVVKQTAYDPPPKAGRGSTTAAWRTYATEHGITVADDADRDDVITACRTAGIPTE